MKAAAIVISVLALLVSVWTQVCFTDTQPTPSTTSRAPIVLEHKFYPASDVATTTCKEQALTGCAKSATTTVHHPAEWWLELDDTSFTFRKWRQVSEAVYQSCVNYEECEAAK